MLCLFSSWSLYLLFSLVFWLKTSYFKYLYKSYSLELTSLPTYFKYLYKSYSLELTSLPTRPSKCWNFCPFLTIPKHRCSTLLTRNTIASPSSLFITSEVWCNMLLVADAPTSLWSRSIYNSVNKFYVVHYSFTTFLF